MRSAPIALAFFLAAGSGWAQCHRIGEVNAEKPDGAMLQQIGQESDAAKKAALLEQFVAKFPQSDAIGWVDDQMVDAYSKTNNPDKVLAAAEKALALPPACVEDAQQALKAAEAKKDPDLVAKWSGITAQQAQKVMALPKPANADDVDNWKRQVDYATQVNTYSEYALYAAALQSPDAAKKAMLIEALQQRNPKSQYLAQAYPSLFQAYRQSGQNDKAVALAEKVVATDQSDEDMLLVLADSYLQTKRNPDQIHAYTAKIVELMASKPAPQGVSAADWAKRKDLFTGVAHFISGKLYYEQGKFAPSDKELREALPLIGNDPNMRPEALYYLAFANYKMQKIQDAATYYKECAALHSRFQALATKNLTALHSQYRGVK